MKPDPEIKKYIEQFRPDFREVLYRLRELIIEVVPEVKEAIKWGMPTYSYQEKNVCYIAGFKKHVSFSFYDGTMLNDPEGLLLGTGKYMKHIKLKSTDEIDKEQLRVWILEGFYT